METNGPAAGRSSKVLVGIVGVAVGLHAMAAWSARAIGLLVTQDDARYILLARSLRSGGYYDLFSVDLPVHTLYPPGYPALLAAWGALFGEGFSTFIVLSVLLSAASLWILFLALRRLVSQEFATLCVLTLAAHSALILRAGSVRSEVPFMFFLALFVWSVTHERASSRHLIVAAFAALAAALTRSLGAALPLALLLHLLLGRRYRALVAVGVAGLLTVGVWQSLTLFSAGEASPTTNYVSAVTAGWADPAGANVAQVVVDRIARNVSSYAKVLPGQLFPAIPGTPIDNAIALLVWTAALVAGGMLFLRRWRPVVLALAITALVLAVWPHRSGRFVEPYLPIIVPCVLLGSGYLAGRVKDSWRRPVMFALAGLFTLTGIVETTRAVRTRADCGEFSLESPPNCIPSDTRSFLRAVEYVDRELPEDALFVSAKPEPLYYYTGRQSINYRTVRSARASTDMSALLREHEVSHVLLGSVHFTEPEILEGRLTSMCEELSVEASFPPRTLLLALRDDDASGRGDAPGTGVDDSPAPTERNACAALLGYRAANIGHDFHLGRRRPPRSALPARP
jgi:hypothetical protein